MEKRTITGIIIVAAACLVMACSHIPGVLVGAVGLLSAISVYELLRAAGLGRNHPMVVTGAVAAMLLIALPIPHDTHLLMVVFALAVAYFIFLMIRQDSCTLKGGYQILPAALLVVLLFKAAVPLRTLPMGLIYLISAITLCFVTDATAYLVGSRFGRHKLLPKVSPHKTWEGAAAGAAASILAMLLLGYLLVRSQAAQIDWLGLCVYGLTGSAVGQFGDLSMSVVKRICGVKDYGNLLPGHGGILDRFDSHLFCIAYTLLFCTLTGGFLCFP